MYVSMQVTRIGFMYVSMQVTRIGFMYVSMQVTRIGFMYVSMQVTRIGFSECKENKNKQKGKRDLRSTGLLYDEEW